METKFVDGLFCNEKKDWMDANLGFTSKFIDYYKNNCDAKGNLKIVITTSDKTGKQYAKLNDWKPQEKLIKDENGKIQVEERDELEEMTNSEINLADIPF